MTETAVDIRRALFGMWPAGRYVHIHEAPLDPSRQGCKIDVAVIGCWKTLGYEIDAVEIKCSVADFRKEIERRKWETPPYRLPHDRLADPLRPAMQHRTRAQAQRWLDNAGMADVEPSRVVENNRWKNAEWRAVAHRFWIACPASIGPKIGPMLPAMWGLIIVDGRGCTKAIPAVKVRNPQPVTWPQVVGLLRTVNDQHTQRVQLAPEPM